MHRERTPFKREFKGDIIINIADIFRNPEIQDHVIKECMKLKNVKTNNYKQLKQNEQ